MTTGAPPELELDAKRNSRRRTQGEVLEIVGRASSEREIPVYLVGGAVRDLLLKCESNDIDVALETTPEGFRRLASDLAATSGFSLVARHDRFGTATLDTPFGHRLDLATARRERYPEPASLPVVESGVAIEEDLSRRDFTIHAMARRVGPNGRLGPLVDLYGGQADLEKKVLRLLHPDSLADDPTRAIRAARYGARLGFRLETAFPKRLEVSRARGAFDAISGDRLRRALEELLHEPTYSRAITCLVRLGVLDDVVIGWGSHVPPRAAMAALPSGVPVAERWAALLALAPAALRRSIADRLNFSRKLRRETESQA
jgi:tRNA nucleotidyltransferase (CCA-adding enzyme)